jgi:DNA polymerase III epsilon subunit-like protein
MLKDAPWFKDKASDLKKFIEGHDRVVAHNLSFDMDRVNNEMERAGLVVEWPKDRICTVEQTEWLKGFRLSLGALYEFLFKENFPNAHRAENDVRAMSRCYIELIKREWL